MKTKHYPPWRLEESRDPQGNLMLTIHDAQGDVIYRETVTPGSKQEADIREAVEYMNRQGGADEIAVHVPDDHAIAVAETEGMPPVETGETVETVETETEAEPQADETHENATT